MSVEITWNNELIEFEDFWESLEYIRTELGPDFFSENWINESELPESDLIDFANELKKNLNEYFNDENETLFKSSLNSSELREQVWDSLINWINIARDESLSLLREWVVADLDELSSNISWSSSSEAETTTSKTSSNEWFDNSASQNSSSWDSNMKTSSNSDSFWWRISEKLTWFFDNLWSFFGNENSSSTSKWNIISSFFWWFSWLFNSSWSSWSSESENTERREHTSIDVDWIDSFESLINWEGSDFSDYATEIERYSWEIWVPSNLLLKLFIKEWSRWDPRASAPWSSALWFWQILNWTWEDIKSRIASNYWFDWSKLERYNPEHQIIWASLYLRHLYDNHTDWDWADAVVYYHTWPWISDSNVAHFLELNPAIERNMNWMPANRENYMMAARNYYLWTSWPSWNLA